MIVTLHPDGTTTANPSGAPTSFLPDGTGYRVVMRFIQAAEGLITYNGIVAKHASYTNMIATHADYDALITDGNLAENNDVDIACVMSGCSLSNGREGFGEIDSATCQLSVIDRTGTFDPRNENTALGPGRRARAGTWVQVSVWFSGIGWRAMFTGLVETWERTMDANNPGVSDVRIGCADFFTGLGAATFSGAVTAQLTGARATMLLNTTWQLAWATTSIAAGVITLDARTLDDEGVLDLLKAGAVVEDGRVFVAPSGQLRVEDASWRTTRSAKLTVLGDGANEFREGLTVCTYKNIAATVASYTALIASFLVYDDMRVCSSTGSGDTLPTVCASAMTASDSSEDVINEVALEYSAPQTPVGYVAATGEAVVAAASIEYVAIDAASIERFGKRSVKRNDLTPQDHAGVLPTLASTLVNRFKDGDAVVTNVVVNLTAEPGSARYVTELFSGDVINVVDVVPEVANMPDDYYVTLTEVMGLNWNMAPDTFDVELVLDEIRAN